MKGSELKFLCVADTHGLVPPDADESGVVAWLHAGDFFNRCDGFAGPMPLAELREWKERRRIPVYAVQGNHDGGSAAGLLGNYAQDVTGDFVKVAPGLWLGGVGWSGQKHYDLPSDSMVAASCEKMFDRAVRVLSKNDQYVLLSHYPAHLPEVFPANGIPQKEKYDCVRTLIERLPPLAVVQGHAHGLFGALGVHRFKGRGVLIVNPGPRGGTLTVFAAKRRAIFQPLPV